MKNIKQKKLKMISLILARLVQLAERNICNVDVGSSSLSPGCCCV